MKKWRYAFGALQVVQKGWKDVCGYIWLNQNYIGPFYTLKKGKSENYLEIYEKALEDFKQGTDITMFNDCITK